ncbi:Uncharacterised protein [Mycobacteroides abscessus]|nr:Uncharacterised protein [Mycobacteroides abscessus]
MYDSRRNGDHGSLSAWALGRRMSLPWESVATASPAARKLWISVTTSRSTAGNNGSCDSTSTWLSRSTARRCACCHARDPRSEAGASTSAGKVRDRP